MLRATLWIGLVLCGTALAADVPSARRRSPDFNLIVPVDPRPHDRLQWFGRKDHHTVPGTVTINEAPYVCDSHGRGFRDRDRFTAHLRVEHGVHHVDVADQIVIIDGIVHWVGNPDMPDDRSGVDSR